jgi:hypothetical protein
MEPTPDQRAARDWITAGLAQAGLALPGTLTIRAYACGKPNCRCHADPPRLHGPYAEWTRKIGGKTITRRLTPAELAEYQPLFDNAKNSAPCSANSRTSPSRSSRQAAPPSTTRTRNRRPAVRKMWAKPA